MNRLVQHFIRYRFVMLLIVHDRQNHHRSTVTVSKLPKYSNKYYILKRLCSQGGGESCSSGKQLFCAVKHLLPCDREKTKHFLITSKNLLRQILEWNYAGTKGSQRGINWISINVPPTIESASAKDSDCTIKISEWRMKPISSVLGGQVGCSWSMRTRWCVEAVMNTNITRECCGVQRQLWLLTAVCTVSASLQRWLCSVHPQPFNSRSYPGQQWGMRFLVKTLAN